MSFLFLDEEWGLLTTIENGLPKPLVSTENGKVQTTFSDSSFEQATNSSLFSVYPIKRWIREGKLGGIMLGRGPSGPVGE